MCTSRENQPEKIQKSRAATISLMDAAGTRAKRTGYFINEGFTLRVYNGNNCLYFKTPATKGKRKPYHLD
jgi:hypothetical protein